MRPVVVVVVVYIPVVMVRKPLRKPRLTEKGLVCLLLFIIIVYGVLHIKIRRKLVDAMMDLFSRDQFSTGDL